MADQRDVKRKDIERLIDAFGSDQRRWPESRRRALEGGLAEPTVKERLAAEATFERLLSEASQARPSAGFAQRVQAAAAARGTGSHVPATVVGGGDDAPSELLVGDAALADRSAQGQRSGPRGGWSRRGWQFNALSAAACLVCLVSGIYAGADAVPMAALETAAEQVGLVTQSQGDVFALLASDDDLIGGESL